MAIESVNVPRFLDIAHPKFTLRVDLAKFGTDEARGAAFAKGIANICADHVGAKTFEAMAPATIAAAQARLDSLYGNPGGGGFRPVDDVRDMLETSLGAKKAASRSALAVMDADQLATLADVKTVKQIGAIVGADPERIAALVALADGADDATRKATIAAAEATVAAARAKAKAKAAAKAKSA